LTADILVCYQGTIPVKVDAYLTDVGGDVQLAQYVAVHFYEWDGQQGAEITDVVQLHEDDCVYCVMTLHLPQDNTLMNLSGSFTAEIFAVQWNEYPYNP